MNLTLKHLNNDTSWLIRYNNFEILLDPWLFSSQIDYFSWFSNQRHLNESSIENLINDSSIKINAILISHHFTDHCHEETLRSLSCEIPIFATKLAKKRLEKWNYFLNIYLIPCLNNNKIENLILKNLSKENIELSLITFLSVGYIEETGLFSLSSLHGAICLAFYDEISKKWNSLLYIPHGCHLNSIQKWFNKQSNLNIQILLQGFDKISIPKYLGGLINYGYKQGLQIIETFQIKHWISTHDEQKIAKGFISKVLKRDYSNIDNVKHFLNEFNQKYSYLILYDIPNGQSITIDLSI